MHDDADDQRHARQNNPRDGNLPRWGQHTRVGRIAIAHKPADHSAVELLRSARVAVNLERGEVVRREAECTAQSRQLVV